ncbi:formimidoylglutamate deiminase [Enterovirga aerilata]|uniref:Formimidoylglutamate deiminase n=1 Tax=Enterovirga aerilata TaxID=2730920 RepID=A0A849I2B8_9HYPH|nr:formimidoylglutamate deiminase [Enterovirga sp. DB1703]NNM73522.1 formimidoylglutamate deiminase [Enterovirga sp. DB1703]
MSTFLIDHAFLPSGFARDVRVEVEGGLITSVEPDRPTGAAERLRGIAVPGMPNLHSHAFQRGMAGLAERRGPANDTFWTWREVMYRFLGRLSPEDVEAVAAHAYAEMLEGGYTLVGEFHYLHHDTEGRPYSDIAELAGRIAAAAAEAGIGLTLLPCFYAQGGFGGRPPVEGQRRFINDPGSFARLLDGARRHLERVPGARMGVAPHSLRAVTPEALETVVGLAPDGPVHIHAAEQWLEVEDCVAWSGRRPVEWLLENAELDQRWCLIHATHMTADETVRLAASGAVAGLCPLTEASLGDGTFEGPRFLLGGGAFGIGTDSNIQIDVAAELRQLEYSQRLHHRGRNVMTLEEGESTGRRLFTAALAGGARAMAQPMGAIEPGRRADFVVLDAEHPALAAAGPESWLDCWIFSAGRDLVKDVIAGGERVVTDRRHHRRDAIAARYRAALARLVGGV